MGNSAAHWRLRARRTRHARPASDPRAKLYGRERRSEALLAAFDRVLKSGALELVLVSGYSGIGKSSVVNELHKGNYSPRVGWSRRPAAWVAGSARASRMAVRALRLLRRPVSTIEQRAWRRVFAPHSEPGIHSSLCERSPTASVPARFQLLVGSASRRFRNTNSLSLQSTYTASLSLRPSASVGLRASNCSSCLSRRRRCRGNGGVPGEDQAGGGRPHKRP